MFSRSQAHCISTWGKSVIISIANKPQESPQEQPLWKSMWLTKKSYRANKVINRMSLHLPHQALQSTIISILWKMTKLNRSRPQNFRTQIRRMTRSKLANAKLKMTFKKRTRKKKTNLVFRKTIKIKTKKNDSKRN